LTKLARLGSVEHGIRQALKILGDDGAEDALERVLGVRRSASLIRKCADPDNNSNHIQLRYAIALDVACVEAGYDPPLSDMAQHLVHRLAAKTPKSVDKESLSLSSAVIEMQSALGNLARAVLDAQNPDGPDGAGLSNWEKHEIFEASNQIDAHIRNIKLLIE
jgi:hypothetical protein